jgi:hypothetical protein
MTLWFLSAALTTRPLKNAPYQRAKPVEKPSPSSTLLRAQEGISVVCSTIVLPVIVIWMMVAPIPVIALLFAGRQVKFAIVSVPLA